MQEENEGGKKKPRQEMTTAAYVHQLILSYIHDIQDGPRAWMSFPRSNQREMHEVVKKKEA